MLAVPLLALLVQGQAFDTAKTDAAGALVREAIGQGKTPGLVAVAGDRRGVRWEQAFGNRQVKPAKEPATLDTVWDMASLTKPVATATSIWILVDRGRIDPDQPVSRYLPDFKGGDRGLADLAFAFFDRMVVFDQITKTILAVGHARTDGDLKQRYAEACAQVDDLVARLSAPATLPPVDIAALGDVVEDTSSTFTHECFISAVNKAKEYIQAGDIFQVVLSQRLETRTHLGAFPIYRALRVVNPSPFLFLLRQGPLSLVGSSPEIMVRVDECEVTIRPLAGTRKRGKDSAEDDALAAELLADPKERAEHIMLVDLGRNDVGRVAEFGSVRLKDVLTVERYSHVMHLCSTVTGQVRKDLTALEALRACLPAGTLSGAPKVRAMEIIDELEPVKRGPYGGAVGYVDFSGNMDTCIALRTLILKDGVAHVQAGAGVVADSVPESEWQETLNKARGLMRALQLAGNLQDR